MRKELDKKYNPSEFEDRLYAEWEEKGYFAPSHKEGAEHFSATVSGQTGISTIIR